MDHIMIGPHIGMADNAECTGIAGISTFNQIVLDNAIFNAGNNRRHFGLLAAPRHRQFYSSMANIAENVILYQRAVNRFAHFNALRFMNNAEICTFFFSVHTVKRTAANRRVHMRFRSYARYRKINNVEAYIQEVRILNQQAARRRTKPRKCPACRAATQIQVLNRQIGNICTGQAMTIGSSPRNKLNVAEALPLRFDINAVTADAEFFLLQICRIIDCRQLFAISFVVAVTPNQRTQGIDRAIHKETVNAVFVHFRQL